MPRCSSRPGVTHPSSAQSETPVATSISALGVCVALPKLCNLQPISPHVFTFAKLLMFILTFAALEGQACCSTVSLRLVLDLLWSLLNKSFAFVRY